jgi:hypothetical protein
LIFTTQGGLTVTQTADAPRTFTLLLLNGKTGSPIRWRGAPSIGFPSGQTSARRTNFFGKETVRVDNPDDRQVDVSVDFIDKDCRSENYEPRSETYSIEEILKSGIVSKNFCGKYHAQPRPGLLAIYVVPATFKELWYE